MSTLFAMYVVLGFVLMLVALPLLFGKVPPNPLYGFRLRPATDDPAIWYPTNRHSARWLIAGGLSTVVVAIGLRLVPGIRLDAYALGCLAVFSVVLLAGLVQTIRFMNALARQKEQGPR
jgi:hypothetical protein